MYHLLWLDELVLSQCFSHHPYQYTTVSSTEDLVYGDTPLLLFDTMLCQTAPQPFLDQDLSNWVQQSVVDMAMQTRTECDKPWYGLWINRSTPNVSTPKVLAANPAQSLKQKLFRASVLLLQAELYHTSSLVTGEHLCSLYYCVHIHLSAGFSCPSLYLVLFINWTYQCHMVWCFFSLLDTAGEDNSEWGIAFHSCKFCAKLHTILQV